MSVDATAAARRLREGAGRTDGDYQADYGRQRKTDALTVAAAWLARADREQQLADALSETVHGLEVANAVCQQNGGGQSLGSLMADGIIERAYAILGDKQGPFPGQAASAAPGITAVEQRTGDAAGQGQQGVAAERNADRPAPDSGVAS